MLQIKIYDAAEKTRTLVELPPGKQSPSKKEARAGEIGDRDGYPGRGLGGWRERAGGVQRNFLGLVRHQTKALAGTG